MKVIEEKKIILEMGEPHEMVVPTITTFPHSNFAEIDFPSFCQGDTKYEIKIIFPVLSIQLWIDKLKGAQLDYSLSIGEKNHERHNNS